MAGDGRGAGLRAPRRAAGDHGAGLAPRAGGGATGGARAPARRPDAGGVRPGVRARAAVAADAQLAEELAIRHADAEFGRRFGVEHHGGLLNGRVRHECLSRMFLAIENNHNVTSEQISVARGHRNQTFDLAVGLLFLPLYSLGATIACRWLYRRFSSNERYVGLVAMGLASIAAAFLGIQCFRLWGGVWEVIRVGNGHMTSIRAASYSRWIQQYGGADFVGGILVFWLIALICYRFLSDDEYSADIRAPRGILLR